MKIVDARVCIYYFDVGYMLRTDELNQLSLLTSQSNSDL